MIDAVLLYSPDKAAAALRLEEAIRNSGYGINARAAGQDGLEGEGGVAKAVIVIWSRASMALAPVQAAAEAARRSGRLIEVSVDGIMPVRVDDSGIVLLSGWRGEPFHPGWQRIKAALDRLCGAPSPAAAGAPRKAPAPAAAPPPAASGAADPAPPQAAARAPVASAPREPARQRSRWLVPALAGSALLAAAAGGATWWGSGSPAPQPEAVAPAAPVQAEPGATRPPAQEPMPTTAPPMAEAAPDTPDSAGEAAEKKPSAAASKSKAAEIPAATVSGRYSPKNSKIMRQFCERSGRSTAQCRAFRRAQAAGDGAAGESRRRPAEQRVRYRNAENMRLFCDRAGKGTRECRVFLRNTRGAE